MWLLVQIIVVLVCVGIVWSAAREAPVTFPPWIRFAIIMLAALILVLWLLGSVGVLGPAIPWRYPAR